MYVAAFGYVMYTSSILQKRNTLHMCLLSFTDKSRLMKVKKQLIDNLESHILKVHDA